MDPDDSVIAAPTRLAKDDDINGGPHCATVGHDRTRAVMPSCRVAKSVTASTLGSGWVGT